MTEERKAPVYQYEKYVEKSKIVINPKQSRAYRYSLYIPFKYTGDKDEGAKCALVIMKNPSKANTQVSDKTINNVLSFCYKKYKGVYLGNLYPTYGTNPNKLSKSISPSCYNEKMKKNREILLELIDKVDDVIIAWGSNDMNGKYSEDYDKNIAYVTNILRQNEKNIMAVRFKTSTYPWHPRNWGSSFELELYSWNK